ncbi:MAG: hypothetical protein K0R51_2547 [Cytophagaceae bacterium]|jgi:hypothetical protein|nr:hypothetical protein [Cytophagaceae bacterium]
MKKIILTLVLFCSASLSAFAQKEDYAFIDIDYAWKKLTIIITKDGSSTKTELVRQSDQSTRPEIIKLMNTLNEEGYQLLHFAPYTFSIGTGSSLSEAYVFIRRK